MPDIVTTLEMTASIWLELACKPYIKGRVLDIGCGRKPYEQMFDTDEWVGLDIRPVGDVHADAHRLPFDEESFDTVLCVNMLHECPSPLTVVMECSRVLKPEGFFVVCAPNAYIDDDALWGIKRKGLDYLIGTAGLSGVELVAHGKLFTREWADFREFTKYGQVDPDGWLSHMDERYPLLTSAIARKE